MSSVRWTNIKHEPYVVICLCKNNPRPPRDWDVLLPYAMAAYRSFAHDTTDKTPNRLMLGREVATPATLLASVPPDSTPRTP